MDVLKEFSVVRLLFDRSDWSLDTGSLWKYTIIDYYFSSLKYYFIECKAQDHNGLNILKQVQVQTHLVEKFVSLDIVQAKMYLFRSLEIRFSF